MTGSFLSLMLLCPQSRKAASAPVLAASVPEEEAEEEGASEAAPAVSPEPERPRSVSASFG